MSSPLDARIRAAAREEVAAAMGNTPADADSAGDERIEALENAVTRLYDNQRRLDARLDALEKGASVAGQATKPVVRRTRKAADE